MIRKDIMKLTVRMAKSGMIRGVCRSILEVGLFTVVKKVEDDGTIVLRLALDQRVPNEYWDTPPWSPNTPAAPPLLLSPVPPSPPRLPPRMCLARSLTVTTSGDWSGIYLLDGVPHRFGVAGSYVMQVPSSDPIRATSSNPYCSVAMTGGTTSGGSSPVHRFGSVTLIVPSDCEGSTISSRSSIVAQAEHFGSSREAAVTFAQNGISKMLIRHLWLLADAEQ